MRVVVGFAQYLENQRHYGAVEGDLGSEQLLDSDEPRAHEDHLAGGHAQVEGFQQGRDILAAVSAWRCRDR